MGKVVIYIYGCGEGRTQFMRHRLAVPGDALAPKKVPFLKFRSQFKSQLKILQGATFFRTETVDD